VVTKHRSAGHYSRRPHGDVAIPALHRAIDRFGDEASSPEGRFVFLGSEQRELVMIDEVLHGARPRRSFMSGSFDS
jgi:hypothetical protein